MTVKTVKLKDINDRELLYITFEHNNKKEAINVGLKTFNRIEELLKSDQPELPLSTEDKTVTNGEDKLAGKMDKQNKLRRH